MSPAPVQPAWQVFLIIRRRDVEPSCNITGACLHVHAQVAWPFMWFLPPLMWLNNLVRPGKGAAVFIPSSLLRYLTFKLTVDLQQIPALQVSIALCIATLCLGSAVPEYCKYSGGLPAPLLPGPYKTLCEFSCTPSRDDRQCTA